MEREFNNSGSNLKSHAAEGRSAGPADIGSKVRFFLPETPEEAAGRLLMIGWEGRESGDLRALVDEFRPGGLIFFKRNYPLRLKQNDWPDLAAPGALQEMLRLIQKYARKITGRALLMAVDQEGGLVRRLPEPYFQLPSARELGLLGARAAESLARRVGRELYESGFNLNLAPVLDLDAAKGGYIGRRSFGCEPEAVKECGRAFLAGLSAWGILACGKHFPGLGGAVPDPHKQTAEIDLPGEDIDRAVDIFRVLIEAGLPAVMTTHAYYPALDQYNMATFSREIVRCLRQDIGFAGLLLTDDLEMGAVSLEADPGLAAVKAVLAGHDLLLVCRRPEVIRAVHKAVLEAILSNQITQGHLMESGLRLRRFLERLPY
jgi:beta-N-acetylhexosaminidase